MYEEVGLSLEKITYKYSQYWPFTNNLMLGFEANISSEKIKINKNEIQKLNGFRQVKLKNYISKKINTSQKRGHSIFSY